MQDAALKAIKQDEFQKVQQAYELLSDDTKRQQYDDQVKLFELRKEMGRGNPTPRSNPFEYEVKTAEPRANSYARAAPKVYTYPAGVPRSHEDLYDEPVRHTPKKSSSYESATDRDRKRPSARDDDAARREALLRKLQEEERFRADERARDERARAEERIRSEKARDRDRRERSHKEKTKSREKDRKSRGEEKGRKTYVEDDSSDDEVYRARAAEKKARRMEEEIRRREAEAAAMRAQAEAERERVQHVRAEEARAAKIQAQRSQIKEAPMDPKWSDHRDFAGAYMQAARRKVAVEPEDDRHPPHPGLRRGETFAGNPSPAYNVQYATVRPPQQYSDDEARRSSGHKDPRRSSDTPPSSKREKSRKRSPERTTRDPYINIVEPPSPSPAGPPKKPSLQSYQSAPPNLSQSRKEPSRSRTTDNYSTPRKDAVPPLPRAQTFTSGDTGRGREHGSSRLRKEYAETDSDSDSPTYQARPSHSPRRAPEPTVYRVAEGRAHPTPSRSHRSDLHNLNEPSYAARERSTSPRGTPGRHERPPITRNPPSGEYRTPPTSNYYTAPEPPPVKPIVVTALRPKLGRDGSSSRSHRHQPPAAAYDQVKYAPTYDTSNVSYSNYPGANLYDTSRRASDSRDYYPPPHRSRGDPVYA